MTPMMNQLRHRSILSSSNLTVRIHHLDMGPNTNLLQVHKDDISREQLKELLYEEILSFNPVPMT